MRARPSGSRAGRWGVVAVAAAACASAAWGDDDATSGSPSFTSKVRAIAGTAADTSSVNLRLRGTVAQATVGGAASAQSTNFRLAGGIAQVPPQLQTGQPLVFGLLALTGPNAGKPQSFGSAEGGDSVQLVGANFQAPGAGQAFVSLGPSLVASTVTSNTTIQFTTPPGKDFTGTPLGPQPLTLLNGNGGVVLDDAFVFTPALVVRTPPLVGQSFELVLAAPSAGQLYLLLGAPGGAIKVPPLLGALQIFIAGPPVGPLPMPAGEVTLDVPVPDVPALAGVSVSMQGAHVPTGPTPGSFTNAIVVTIQ